MMKISFLTALLIAACEAKSKGKGKPEWTYACCEIEEKGGVVDGISGSIFFLQSCRHRGMKAYGSLSKTAATATEDGEEECRYLGITEGVSVDSCDNEGDLWPFGEEEAAQCALKPVCFDEASGMAEYEYGASRAQLAEVIDSSVSLYDTAVRDDESVIDACCTITRMDNREKFCEAVKEKGVEGISECEEEEDSDEEGEGDSDDARRLDDSDSDSESDGQDSDSDSDSDGQDSDSDSEGERRLDDSDSDDQGSASDSDGQGSDRQDSDADDTNSDEEGERRLDDDDSNSDSQESDSNDEGSDSNGQGSASDDQGSDSDEGTA